MLPYFVLALFLVAAAVVLMRSAGTAGGAQILGFLRYLAIALGVVFGVLGLITGRPLWAVAGFAIAGVIALVGRPGRKWRPSGRGRASDIETAYLRMALDHETGQVAGEVLDGRYRGRRIEELSTPELVDLLAECLAADPQGAQLLEAYLDRIEPGWREVRAGPGSEEAQGPMTREEAFKILGLEPNASPDEIRDAHRRLMKHHHPDHGGSTYLAAKINEAKELLLDGG